MTIPVKGLKMLDKRELKLLSPEVHHRLAFLETQLTVQALGPYVIFPHFQSKFAITSLCRDLNQFADQLLPQTQASRLVQDHHIMNVQIGFQIKCGIVGECGCHPYITVVMDDKKNFGCRMIFQVLYKTRLFLRAQWRMITHGIAHIVIEQSAERERMHRIIEVAKCEVDHK
jgi:hypothetical protein